jgi:hypothetical protein
MRAIVRVALVGLVGLVLSGHASGAAIRSDLQQLGENLFRIDYSVEGFEFQENQELEIIFDPDVFVALSNGSAPAGFDLLLIQPGNPPGTVGRFSALALLDAPDLSSGFSLQVETFLSKTPGVQEFAINQFDGEGNFVSTIATGPISSAIPEPSTFSLAGLALLIAGAPAVCRRWFRKPG